MPDRIREHSRCEQASPEQGDRAEDEELRGQGQPGAHGQRADPGSGK